MATVQFIKVGRHRKKSWTVEIRYPTPDNIADEAAAILGFDDAANVHAEDNRIFYGFRPIGQYRILPAQRSLKA